MKTLRGIVKWTIRREGRIGRVWQRRGTVAAEPGSEKERTDTVALYDPNQAKDRRILRRVGCDRSEASNA
jgi:hypothetical protein